MKIGDLIEVDSFLYPRLKSKTGVLIKEAPEREGKQWIVFIMDRVHPYYIDENDMSKYCTVMGGK